MVLLTIKQGFALVIALPQHLLMVLPRNVLGYAQPVNMVKGEYALLCVLKENMVIQ